MNMLLADFDAKQTTYRIEPTQFELDSTFPEHAD